MFSGDIPPSPRLASYIRTYRILDVLFAAGDPIQVKAYPPRPQHTLCFYPKDPNVSQFGNSNIIASLKTSLMGQQTITCNYYVPKIFLVFMVVFQPGALYRLIRISADELNNCFMDSELLFGKDVSFVNEQLFHASSYAQMIAIVETYLAGLISRCGKDTHPVDRIGRLMQESIQMHSIDWFCREACLSPRQFERKFREHMGISPKHYARTIRFDRAFRMKNRYPATDWLTIALHCGYHDYQHLVKDYKDFTGCTPNEFYALEQKAPERLFGDVET